MDTPETNPLLTAFETMTCSRCGGGGKYSYCQMYGNTCFKCHGAGKVYTKRGMAAIAYRTSLRSVPANQVQVGWLFYVEGSVFGGKAGWMKVVAVGEDHGSKWGKKNPETGETEWQPYFTISCDAGDGVSGYGHSFCNPTDLAKAIPDKGYLKTTTKLALEYQATLNKTGQVTKSRKAKATA